MAIKILNAQLINQIAAGEVIERPSSILKELLENSFDAYADQITVEAENGGVTFLKITDNGHGIEKAELPLALTQHATSKIQLFEDLNTLETLGFRGEALASIASITKFKLISRTATDQIAHQITCEGNPNQFKITPAVHPLGTTVEIRDLFFNVPVRQKFLKKPATEYNYLSDWLGKLILSHNEISFVFKHNQKTIWQFSPAFDPPTQLHRANKILTENFSQRSIPIKAEREGYKLYGWISDPSLHKNQNDFQYLYLNRRWIRDKTLMHAIRLAYEDLLPLHTHPVTLLFLEVNPQLFDVNVHPTKNEVRFNEPKILYSFVFNALKQGLLQRKTNPVPLPPVNLATKKQNLSPFKPLTNVEVQKINQQFKAETKSACSANNLTPQTEQKTSVQQLALTATASPLRSAPCKTPDSLPDQFLTDQATVLPPIEEPSSPKKVDLGKALAQIHNTYLLAENSEGLVIVDIHAACERITYEQLKNEFRQYQRIPAQRLLSPLTVSLKNVENLENHSAFLKTLGFEWRISGEKEVTLLSLPALLSHPSENIFIEVINELTFLTNANKVTEQVNHFLATLACHNSVRAGQALTLPESNQLLKQIEQLPNSDRCNHGRPTWIQFTQKDLNKLFLRT